MKILVTGASGFVGRFVTMALSKKHEVVGVDRAHSTGIKWNDLTSVDETKLLIQEVKPDAVVHLAALAGSRGKGGAAESKKDPYNFLNNNVNATLNVLEAMRLNEVKKLVYISSFATYGANPPCPIDEHTRLNPNNAYGLSKCLSEDLVRFYSTLGIRAVILRPTLICGETQREVNALREFVIAALSGKPIEIWGKGLHRREFIHPSDVADAIARSLSYLNDLKDFDTFVLGNEPVSMFDLAYMVVKKIPSGRIEFKPPGPQAFDQFTNHERAKVILGWKPKISTEEIIKRVIEDMKIQ